MTIIHIIPIWLEYQWKLVTWGYENDRTHFLQYWSHWPFDDNVSSNQSINQSIINQSNQITLSFSRNSCICLPPQTHFVYVVQPSTLSFMSIQIHRPRLYIIKYVCIGLFNNKWVKRQKNPQKTSFLKKVNFWPRRRLHQPSTTLPFSSKPNPPTTLLPPNHPALPISSCDTTPVQPTSIGRKIHSTTTTRTFTSTILTKKTLNNLAFSQVPWPTTHENTFALASSIHSWRCYRTYMR